MSDRGNGLASENAIKHGAAKSDLQEFLVAEKSGANILVECLIDLGVDTVFGYPGGAVLPIYDTIY